MPRWRADGEPYGWLAYCAQLPTREVVALAAGAPWAMEQALAVLDPPPLLGAGGGILPQQPT